MMEDHEGQVLQSDGQSRPVQPDGRYIRGVYVRSISIGVGIYFWYCDVEVSLQWLSVDHLLFSNVIRYVAIVDDMSYRVTATAGCVVVDAVVPWFPQLSVVVILVGRFVDGPAMSVCPTACMSSSLYWRNIAVQRYAYSADREYVYCVYCVFRIATTATLLIKEVCDLHGGPELWPHAINKFPEHVGVTSADPSLYHGKATVQEIVEVCIHGDRLIQLGLSDHGDRLRQYLKLFNIVVA